MTPETVLRQALEHWWQEIKFDADANGGDMVDWFFGTFVPQAQEALKISATATPELKRYRVVHDDGDLGGVFFCSAEDEGHAREQALNAYPNTDIFSVEED